MKIWAMLKVAMETIHVYSAIEFIFENNLEEWISGVPIANKLKNILAFYTNKVAKCYYRCNNKVVIIWALIRLYIWILTDYITTFKVSI